MEFKRITILCGHYGSGKTNIAVNLAVELSKQKNNVLALDLDIVNPYFRTKDSAYTFSQNGIKLIASQYANSNVDIPALPQEMYAVIDDKSANAVIDVGGDDRGALALGRLAPAINEENNYNMFMVINCFRPLTKTPNDVLEVMREIEAAGKIKFTGLINNSNLGRETESADVLYSVKFAQECSKLLNLPVVLTTVNQKLFAELNGKIENLYPLTLQNNNVI